MICPKCAYLRRPTDTAPDWQCPACGVAYAKVAAKGHGYTVVQPTKDNRGVAAAALTLRVLLILFALISIGAAGFYGWNRYQQAVYQADFDKAYALGERWIGEYRLASSTPRIALSNRVASMQALQLEAKDLDLKSECALALKKPMADAMALSIDGYIDFMEKSEDKISSGDKIVQGGTRFNEVLKQIKDCGK